MINLYNFDQVFHHCISVYLLIFHDNIQIDYNLTINDDNFTTKNALDSMFMFLFHSKINCVKILYTLCVTCIYM